MFKNGKERLKNKNIPNDLRKEDVLALDIATKTGYCYKDGGGTWNFTESKKRNDNKKHKHFRDTLIAFIEEHDIKFIVAEDILLNKMRFCAMVSLSELRGILLEVCDELNLPEPEFVNAITLKKFATGKGNADKEAMKEAMVRDYHKTPVDDNHADAFFLFTYFCRKHKIV